MRYGLIDTPADDETPELVSVTNSIVSLFISPDCVNADKTAVWPKFLLKFDAVTVSGAVSIFAVVLALEPML
jgi:hypothetical protein